MLKDLMVHLDAGADDAPRLALAEALADRHKAHISGLFVNAYPGFSVSADAAGTGAIAMAEIVERAIADGDRDAQAISERMNRLVAPNDFQRIDAVIDQAGFQAARAARHADLFIALRPAGDTPRWTGLIENVLFGSGRGVLLAAPERDPGPIKTIVIGWNGSREAARAVAEAMPFLEKASKVIVVTAEKDPADDALDTRIARHLDRHGVKVTLNELRSNDPGQAILAEAKSSDADLIVAGGYGHSRLREWVLGGVTRTLLEHARAPLLLAH
jgi:nucleotide-binding universal stress UspA family protein